VHKLDLNTKLKEKREDQDIFGKNIKWSSRLITFCNGVLGTSKTCFSLACGRTTI